MFLLNFGSINAASAGVEELSQISFQDLHRLNAVELLQKSGRFEVLLQLLTEADLKGAISSSTAGVIAAPTDEAFAKIPEQVLANLRSNPVALKRVLLAHFSAKGSASVGFFESGLGNELKVSVRTPGQSEGRNLPGFVNGVVSPEIFLVEFQSGTKAKSNRISSVAKPRVEILAIDSVLAVPTSQSYAQFFSSFSARPFKFNKLRELLELAEIPVDALKGKTLLAPTNEAIEALGAETLASLAADPQKLRQILLFHVINSPKSIANLVRVSDNITLTKGTIEVEGLKIRAKGQANVVVADLFVADSTYVHGIDAVLLPQ